MRGESLYLMLHCMLDEAVDKAIRPADRKFTDALMRVAARRNIFLECSTLALCWLYVVLPPKHERLVAAANAFLLLIPTGL